MLKLSTHNYGRMEFVLISENNRKENQNFLHYCQWTGNEHELGRLITVIQQADIHSEPITFQASFTKLPEAVVDLHVSMLATCTKHVGRFTCPVFEENMYVPAWTYAEQLDAMLLGRQLGRYFQN